MPLKAYHAAIRDGCSARVKYMDVMSIKAGSAMASNAPDKTLSARRPPKLFAAAWAMRRAPHMKMLKAR